MTIRKMLTRRELVIMSAVTFLTSGCTGSPIAKRDGERQSDGLAGTPSKWEDVDYFVGTINFTSEALEDQFTGPGSGHRQSVTQNLVFTPRIEATGVVTYFHGKGSRFATIDAWGPHLSAHGAGPDASTQEELEQDASSSGGPLIEVNTAQKYYTIWGGRIRRIPVAGWSGDDTVVDIDAIGPAFLNNLNKFPLPDTVQPLTGSFSPEDVIAYARRGGYLAADSVTTGENGGASGDWQLYPQSLGPRIQKVSVWVNAFIPNNVPDLSIAVPGMTDQWMVPALVWQDCFATDNRTFSDDPAASSRMQSKLEVSPTTFEWVETHKCDQTIEYDCEDGEVEGTGVGDTSRMTFTTPKISDDRLTFETTLTGAANNPLVAASSLVGDIDYSITLSITTTADRRAAVVGLGGSVDAFPAFEAYAQADDGPIQTIFRQSPNTGSPATLLPGPANTPVSGGATLGVF